MLDPNIHYLPLRPKPLKPQVMTNPWPVLRSPNTTSQPQNDILSDAMTNHPPMGKRKHYKRKYRQMKETMIPSSIGQWAAPFYP